MAISKVVLNGEVLMDTTVDTVTSSNLLSTYQATGADGQKVIGAYEPPEDTHFVVTCTYDGESDAWTIDRTFAEVEAARNAGKDILAMPDPNNDRGSELYFDYYENGENWSFNAFYEYGSAMRRHWYYLDETGWNDDGYSDYVAPRGTYTVNSAGTFNISSYASVSVRSGTFNTPAATFNSTTGVFTAIASVTAGYLTASTKTSTYALSAVNATTITPTETAQTAISAGYYAKSAITVNAISSTYVGTGISQRSAADLTANGATVTAPAGYYASSASKSVASGTAGTPTATKGTVSNHSVTVTPSVTNTAGYIEGGTKTGTAVTVTASELASGNKAITQNGTGIDVVGYSTVSVDVTPTYTATIVDNAHRFYLTYNGTTYSASGSFSFSAGDTCTIEAYGEMGNAYIYEDGVEIGTSDINVPFTYSFPNHNITITTSSSGGNAEVDIDSPTLTISQNGTYDVREYASAAVSVAGGGSGENSLKDYMFNLDSTVYSFASTIRIGINNTTPDTFTSQSRFGYYENDLIYVEVKNKGYIFYNESLMSYNLNGSAIYSFSAPANNIHAYATNSNAALGWHVYISEYMVPSGTLAIVENGEYAVSEYASVAVQVTGDGGGITIDDIAMRSISTAIGVSATSISYAAFYGCSSLIAASFPLCTNIGNQAFCACSSMTSISFPVCTIIGVSAFANCYRLTLASFPSCTNIGSSAFNYCTSLITAYFPACTSIGNSAFNYCTSLITAYFPACTSIGSSAFYSCNYLSSISFPLCTRIGSAAFIYCRSLTTVSFPKCSQIASSAFYGCSRLMSVYLFSTSITGLLSTYAFMTTPISGSTYTGSFGSIYVRESLLASYQTATNWSVYSSRFVGLTDAQIAAL